ncbi:type II secretion system F family protein [Primorskyibacter aestuariivivens]|uniref:type II secretion system F family protein n=1 Tax=Primorskyibacter aestuariivivens TaxID=1888912 RepID=UPI002301A8A9|nr:type II secretion system F family protein [Primorskyibacter aestuariivivens]MDA7427609.1 type II secretion system F family protein [Primorskyibacter aestuariivivens]
MNENIVLLAVFVSVLILSFSIISIVNRRREVYRNIEDARRPRGMSRQEIDRFLGSGNEDIRYFLEVTQKEDANSTRMRLVRAGYFKPRAVVYYNLIRLLGALAIFLIIQVFVPILLPEVSTLLLFVVSAVMAGLFYMIMAMVLESMGNKRTREFRKLFPDFMDLLLVCVDAGLSIDAAIDRVTREFLVTTPDFGVQLSIINLEIRAGRPLHEALQNFAYRIQVEEARTLAVLFRQSQELGASVSKTLRTFAKEMRQMRIVRAEEKANALPVKMLFPMALFMFPVNLIIVIVPILLLILEMLLSLSPQ